MSIRSFVTFAPSVDANGSLPEARAMLAANGFHPLVVTEAGTPVGFFGPAELALALADADTPDAAEPERPARIDAPAVEVVAAPAVAVRYEEIPPWERELRTDELGARATVFIIEDDPHMRELEVLMVHEAGYCALAAHSLAEARALLPEVADRVGLVLLDVELPDGDGTDFCRELKESWPDVADVPVVLVTGRTEVDVYEASFEVGSVRFLSKPLAGDELIETITEFMA